MDGSDMVAGRRQAAYGPGTTKAAREGDPFLARFR
jgi:hypothetical protein